MEPGKFPREGGQGRKLFVVVNPREALARFNKAVLEDFMKRWSEAINSYQKFLELAEPQHAVQIAHAQQRLHELGSK
jgi:hypothetical protein